MLPQCYLNAARPSKPMVMWLFADEGVGLGASVRG